MMMIIYITGLIICRYLSMSFCIYVFRLSLLIMTGHVRSSGGDPKKREQQKLMLIHLSFNPKICNMRLNDLWPVTASRSPCGSSLSVGHRVSLLSFQLSSYNEVNVFFSATLHVCDRGKAWLAAIKWTGVCILSHPRHQGSTQSGRWNLFVKQSAVFTLWMDTWEGNPSVSDGALTFLR